MEHTATQFDDIGAIRSSKSLVRGSSLREPCLRRRHVHRIVIPSAIGSGWGTCGINAISDSAHVRRTAALMSNQRHSDGPSTVHCASSTPLEGRSRASRPTPPTRDLRGRLISACESRVAFQPHGTRGRTCSQEYGMPCSVNRLGDHRRS